MIVRISEEAQYELDESHHQRLDDLDNAVVAAVDAGDEARFHEAFEELLRFIRSEGRVLADDDLHPSDVIVPPADLTFVEAGEDFSGEGLVPEPEPTA
jgi:hypothetical protein